MNSGDSAPIGSSNAECNTGLEVAPGLECMLVLVHGLKPGYSVGIGSRACFLGRSIQCDLQVEDENASRIHCKVWRCGSDIWAVDLDSTNGTMVNGVFTTGPIQLFEGDHLVIGNTVLRLTFAESTNGRYYAELVRCATMDSVTGLLNRSAFSERINSCVYRAGSQNARLSLVCIDIDDFDGIKGRFGNAEGDKVLDCCAKVVTSTIGARDIAGRVGRERFSVLMPGTSSEGALALSTMLCHHIRRLSDPGILLFVTASLGVAEMGRGIDSASELKMAAEAALLRAKCQGRNRVSVYHPFP